MWHKTCCTHSTQNKQFAERLYWGLKFSWEWNPLSTKYKPRVVPTVCTNTNKDTPEFMLLQFSSCSAMNLTYLAICSNTAWILYDTKTHQYIFLLFSPFYNIPKWFCIILNVADPNKRSTTLDFSCSCLMHRRDLSIFHPTKQRVFIDLHHVFVCF